MAWKCLRTTGLRVGSSSLRSSTGSESAPGAFQFAIARTAFCVSAYVGSASSDIGSLMCDLAEASFLAQCSEEHIIALIPPSFALMERVFSTLRACLDGRQNTCYSDRIRESALLKYNRGRNIFFWYQGRSSLYCCALYPCDIAVWLQFPVLNLVLQHYCSGVNVERIRGPNTVSLGAVEPREFDLLTPSAQHNVLLCAILKYGIDLTIPDKVWFMSRCGIHTNVYFTYMHRLHAYIHALNTTL